LDIAGLFKRDKAKLNNQEEEDFIHQKEMKELRRLSKLLELERKRTDLILLQHERPLTLEELEEKRIVEKDITERG